MEAALRLDDSLHSDVIVAVMRPGEGMSLDVNFATVFDQSDGMFGCGSIRTTASSSCTLLDCSYCVM